MDPQLVLMEEVSAALNPKLYRRRRASEKVNDRSQVDMIVKFDLVERYPGNDSGSET